jgi:Acetyltransferase (GNAT) domain
MHKRSGLEPVQIDVLDELGGSDWDRLVVSHPDYNFFHCAAWAQVICKTYGHTPIYLHLAGTHGSGALVPVIEVLSPLTGRRAVCLPFSDACGPLVFGENGSNLVKEALSSLARQRDWNYFEIRGGKPLERSAQAATGFYGHRLDLRSGSEQLFDAFTPAARRAIRKGLKSSLNVEILDTPKAVDDFYQLHVQTRKRHGLPPQPAGFFMNIHQHIVKRGLGFVVLARTRLRHVAGAIFFRFHRRALYKFAASDPKFGDQRGNNLVLWEGIKHLAGQGVERLELGRTSLDNDGLRRFKLGWGVQEEMIRYYRYSLASEKWVSGPRRETGFHNRVFRHLPAGVNRMAGAMLYPHLD